MSPTPTIVRVMRRIRISTPDGCWEWPGTTKPNGYGRIRAEHTVDRQPPSLAVHRVTYEHYVGPIPDGLELDHLCRNRACCNPAHLEPVTHTENVRRGRGGANNRDKTHCPQGHPYTADNTRIQANGWRTCVTCKRAQARKADALRRARSSEAA